MYKKIRKLLRKAFRAFEIYQLERAFKIFYKIINYKSTHSKAYLGLALVQHAEDKLSEALEFVNKSLQFNPKSYSAGLLKVIILNLLDKENEAKELFDEVSKLSNEDNSARKSSLDYDLEGIVHANLFQNSAFAKICYEKSVEKNPRFALAIYNKANHLENKEEALLLIEECIKLTSNNPCFVECKCIALTNDGKVDEASDYYDEVNKLNDKDYEYFMKKGDFFSKIFNYKIAIESYEKTIELNPIYVEAYCKVVKLMADLSQSEKGLKICEKAELKLKITSAQFYRSKSILYLDLKNIKGALIAADMAIKFGDEADDYYVKAHIISVLQFDTDIVSKNCDLAISRDPKCLGPYLLKFSALLTSKNPTLTLEFIDHALCIFPNNEELILRKAILLYSMKQILPSLELLNRLNCKKDSMYFYLAKIKLDLGNLKDAYDFFLETSNLMYYSSSANFLKCQILSKMGIQTSALCAFQLGLDRLIIHNSQKNYDYFPNNTNIIQSIQRITESFMRESQTINFSNLNQNLSSKVRLIISNLTREFVKIGIDQIMMNHEERCSYHGTPNLIPIIIEEKRNLDMLTKLKLLQGKVSDLHLMVQTNRATNENLTPLMDYSNILLKERITY